MNNKVRHEIITWGIFIVGVLLMLYPISKLVVILQIPHWLVSIGAVLVGMIWMLVVEWFVKKFKI